MALICWFFVSKGNCMASKKISLTLVHKGYIPKHDSFVPTLNPKSSLEWGTVSLGTCGKRSVELSVGFVERPLPA